MRATCTASSSRTTARSTSPPPRPCAPSSPPQPRRPEVRAIVANRLGGPEVLEEAALADPAPGPGEVVVELRAASVNRRGRGVRLGTIRPQDRGEGEGSAAPFPYVL